ncbi:DUF6153 family protein [Nocardia sp. NPDC052566]|uniref:DUF6153 family protein n=1 Tax=Nocardia sp. NPDC052566 TaxID=3364330 RepID=UPI0037C6D4E4
MIDQQAATRASGLTRLLGVLVLLAGVVAMHVGVFGLASHETAHARTSAHEGMTMPGAAMPGTESPAADPDCGGAGCGGHSGIHGCVFILSVFALAIGLVLLSWLAIDRPGGGVSLPRHWRPRRARPPPWTMPTLAELSILRI